MKQLNTNGWVVTTYLSRHSQLAKIIHQQSAIKYKLFKRNILPYYTYKPELVLGSANMILYSEWSIIPDKTVDFNRPDVVFIKRENKTALVMDIVVPFTQNLSNTEAENIKNMKIWPWKLKISGSLTHLYTPESSELKEWLPKPYKISREYRFNQKHLKSGAKSSIIPNVAYSMQISGTCPLTVGDRMDFLALTEPNPSDTLG